MEDNESHLRNWAKSLVKDIHISNRANKPKLKRALSHILQVVEEERTEYVPL